MKKFFAFLTIVLMASAVELSAQVTVDEATTETEEVSFQNSVKDTEFNTDVIEDARLRAERLTLRKERNTVDFTANLHGSLTAFSQSWQAAGDNTITILANLNFLHTYNKGRFTLTNTASAKFGYNNMKIDLMGDGNMKGVWFKNVDEIALSTSPQWAMVKNWTYGANVKFRTQFAAGYDARGDKQKGNARVSNFMTPGYLDASVGFTYVLPSERFPLKVNLAPLAMSATYRQDLGTSKDYGVLTLTVGFYATCEIVTIVPPSAFMPPPKVSSAVIKLTMRDKPPVDVKDEEMYFKVIKAAFALRRKTLLNALGSANLGKSKEEITLILEKVGIDPKRRGETLSDEEFALIANEF